jgi:hypothetical protein
LPLPSTGSSGSGSGGGNLAMSADGLFVVYEPGGSGRVRFSALKLTWRSKAYYASGAPQKELIAGADLPALQALVVETGSSFIQE